MAALGFACVAAYLWSLNARASLGLGGRHAIAVSGGAAWLVTWDPWVQPGATSSMTAIPPASGKWFTHGRDTLFGYQALVPMWMPLVMSGLGVGSIARRPKGRRGRGGRVQSCEACGYSLDNLPLGEACCPECGADRCRATRYAR